MRSLVDVEAREVSLRVLDDPEILQLELERIFARSWVVLGHESEIPDSGDFVRRSIGLDSVIVTRADDGSISVLLNVCAHRAAEVCRADRGNTARFKCPYHGWVYDSRGDFRGAPFQKHMYGELDNAAYGLTAARVAVRHGVIFGCFDVDTPGLDDWLGEFVDCFDKMFAGKRLEVLGPAQRYLVNANWKLAAEQHTGDTYHAATLHASVAELGFSDKVDIRQRTKVSSRNGHGATYASATATPDVAAFLGPDGYFLEGLLFPSCIVGATSARGLDGKQFHIMTIGGYVPTAVDQFETFRLVLAEADAPDELKAIAVKPTPGTVTIAVDDAIICPSIQGSARGVIGRRQSMKYNAIEGPAPSDDWPLGGYVTSAGKDDNQWNFWLRYLEMMAP